MCGVIYCKYHRGRVVVNCDIYIYIQTMTTVSANLVIGILKNVSIHLESIQNASRNLGNYYNNAQEVVDIWQNEIYHATPNKILPLMYVANDIIQTSKRKGSNFIDAFQKCMKACLRVSVAINPSVTKKLQRLTKVWGDRRVFPRPIVTIMNGAFNENDNDHDGTPNSTPDPSLLISGDGDSPAYTPSPIYSDGENDNDENNDKKQSSSSSSNNNNNSNNNTSQNTTTTTITTKEEHTSTTTTDMSEYNSEISLGGLLYKRVKDIDFRQYTTNFMLNQIGNFQMTPQNGKERVKEVARLVRQYQNHLKSREEKHQAIMQMITSDIKYEESEIENIDEQISELEDSKDYLKEVQEQNDNPKVLILRKKRKKTTEMLRDEKNPKLDFGDDDLNDKDGDQKKKDESPKKKKKEKKQAMIWDNVQKCMVPLYSNQDWRDQ